MRIKNGVTNYYVYGLGLIYEEDDTTTSTTTLTYHFDYRGSTVALTDGNGNVTDRIQYSAYGMTTLRVGTNDTPFLYNGRYGVQTDPNGLLYMRARYYNPYICRFINADPSGFAGGLNFYAYVNGDPISLTDPFGLGAIGEPNAFSWMGGVNSVPGNVPNPNPMTYPFNITGTAAYPDSQVMDLSSMPTPTSAPNAPAAFLSEAPNYLQNQDLTLGSNIDPGSPLGSGMANLNASLLTSALPLPGSSSGGLVGISESEASALARQIYGIQVNGQDAVSLVEAFGSRAGSTFRGPATAASDLDIQIT
jgi:RHS repeat-associated protein